MSKFYTVVTFGSPRGVKIPSYTRKEDVAVRAANEAKGTGTCMNARVYECDTMSLAKTADISEVRAGERIVYSA